MTPMIEEQEMPPAAADLVRTDQEHLIHPLHHPVDNANTVIYVRGTRRHRFRTSTGASISTGCPACGT